MITVKGLTKYYNELKAVNEIDFDIKRGEILGLLGPNGAGKTTTLRMLTGFLPPSSGSIRIKDYNIDEHPLEIKKLLGYLPESAPLYYEMIVYDYLDYVADIREIEKKKKLSRIRQMADLCGLNDIMHRPIGELSKGYKQRVGLAHAMMNDPEILILDEPTSGLDPNQIVEIREIIKHIGKEKTIILSTHILSEAEATCDRIVIINQGKIVADGSARSLKQSGGGETLVSITLKNADINAVKEKLASIEGVVSVSPLEDKEGILNLNINCPYSADIREDIYLAVKETDWILLKLHQETQSLESIFRKLTREN